jgi:hypothetical protein
VGIRGVVLASLLTLLPFSEADQAHAMMLVSSGPDVLLSFPISEADYGELRKSLINFASTEKLTEFKNAPRAKGKAFFLSVYREDLGNFVAEKKSAKSVVTVECYELTGHTARGNRLFRDATTNLETLLKKRWPNIVISQKQDDDRPTFKNEIYPP